MQIGCISQNKITNRLFFFRPVQIGFSSWRAALWRAERAGQSVRPIFANIPNEFEMDSSSPLLSMTLDERLVANFFTTGFCIGPHRMAYHWAKMNSAGGMRDEITPRHV